MKDCRLACIHVGLQHLGFTRKPLVIDWLSRYASARHPTLDLTVEDASIFFRQLLSHDGYSYVLADPVDRSAVVIDPRSGGQLRVALDRWGLNLKYVVFTSVGSLAEYKDIVQAMKDAIVGT